MWGAMGQAAMIGLGLALAQPKRRVLVITGDGEMLMGLGALATIGVQQPANLTVVVIDNERYGETGMQTHAHRARRRPRRRGPRLRVQTSRWSEPKPGWRSSVAIHGKTRPAFAAVKVDAEKLPLVLPPRDGALLKARFRRARC